MGKQGGRGGGGGGGGGGEPELHAAARCGDLVAVQSILSSNPLSIINSRDMHSRTPLHLAAWSGHAPVVTFLCKQKADVGAAAMDDMAAIHFAAQKGHLEVVRVLVSSGASVKASTRKGLTPLHYAVQASHLELVKYLVKKGASITVKTKAGKTPLDLASKEEIRMFLEECSKKGNLNEKETAEESNPNSSLEGQSTNSATETTDAEEHKEQEARRDKRKGEGDCANGSPAESKRSKVALNHLLRADDTGEDENL